MTTTVFLGTPDAALPTLRSLAAVSQLKAVITMPDRPRGRSGTPKAPPAKLTAHELGIEVAQPRNRAELEEVLDDLDPFDVGVVVAYGRILSTGALGAPERGFLNVHFSLLPRWRGAAPVARALMAGDAMSGVTIIELDEGMDTGPVLTAQAIDIRAGESAGELTERLAEVGARLLVDSLPEYLAGTLVPIPQVSEGATHAEMLGPADRLLTSSMTVTDFVNRVRGLSPRPGAHMDIDGVRTLVLRAEAADRPVNRGDWEVQGGWPVAGVGDGGVRLTELQPQGRRPMPGDAWVRGRHSIGGKLGT